MTRFEVWLALRGRAESTVSDLSDGRPCDVCHFPLQRAELFRRIGSGCPAKVAAHSACFDTLRFPAGWEPDVEPLVLGDELGDE